MLLIVGLVIYYKKRMANTNPGSGGSLNSKRPYIYENLIKGDKEAFISKIEDITNELGIGTPNALLAVMKLESGINPAIQNTSFPMANGYATGLIQFTPDTARSLGTTTDNLRVMSGVDQLDYVRKYFLPYKGKMKNFTDVYMVTFFPAVLGKPESTVIATSKISAASVARSNPVFDLNKDMQITIGEFKKAILSKIANYQSYQLA